MKFTLFLLLLFCLACNEGTETASSSTSDNSLPAPPAEASSPPKPDSIYKDISLISYERDISYGMSEEEWNKTIARYGQQGYLQSINDNGDGKSYTGFKTMGADAKFGYRLFGLFSSGTERLGENKIRVYRANGKTCDTYLSGLKYEFNFTNAWEVNQAINDFISDRGLRYKIGDNSLKASDAPPEAGDYFMQNQMEKMASERHSSGEWKETGYTQTGVYEDSKSYYVFKIINSGRAKVNYDHKGDIYSLSDAYSVNNLELKIYSKQLSKININEFATLDQKNRMSEDIKSQKLIDKALSN